MTKMKKLWILWAIAYGLCAVCGFFTPANNLVYALFFMLAILFFVPAGFLIYEAVQRQEKQILRLIRTVSLVSLSVTVVTIVLNFLTVGMSPEWGRVMYWLLILVSAPMVCAQIWVVSLFGWACVLMTCIHFLRKK